MLLIMPGVKKYYARRLAAILGHRATMDRFRDTSLPDP
jgi:hypothetical protein